ncbi:GNAT family N-acetyltransferase [Agrococcus sp. ARC_14]|uniref:GNAT family N-acetyltransferase n=1 Tax=Agrococcus sp. ARC_14 TaxID=2919927 RepID=UPI001F0541DD|nr:GNAT family N-acetyltransferase [Agrococcus sp. ARC_14]MCH1884423.1 GNAT family N-acetyltransferase [Agrococcus sp. ARC_14]
MHSSTVTEHWLPHLPAAAAPRASGTLRVVVDDALSHERRLSVLEPVDGAGVVALTTEMAAALDLADGSELDRPALAAALAGATVRLHGADHLFFLPAEEHEPLLRESVPPHIRQLTEGDAEAFAAFEGEASEGDLDDAYVELDHWLVFGAFVGDELACAASMYPWAGSALADLGVLTLPRFRGQGIARQTVRAMSAHALGLGYEPQYRCQLDNLASVALAQSAGLTRLGSWDVVAEEDAEVAD